jgi:hypothetical protein
MPITLYNPEANMRCPCIIGLLALASAGPTLAAPSAALPFDGVARGYSLTNVVTLHSTNNLAGFQCEVLFDDSRLVCTNAPTLMSGPAGVVVDGALLQPGLYRLLAYSPAGEALTNDVICSLTFSALTNAVSGQVPLAAVTVHFGDANAAVISTGTVGNGLFLVGDAFGFMPGGGRAQFCGTTGSNYLIQASANLTSWTGISTNAATNGLEWIMDPNALVLSKRFYRSVTTP